MHDARLLLLLEPAGPSWASCRGHSDATAVVPGAFRLCYVKQDGAAPGSLALIVRVQAGKTVPHL